MYYKLIKMVAFTKKEFEVFFHKLHCILRNNDTGLTGLSALNEINNFILLIFIEPKLELLYTNGELNDEYKFTHLCQYINDNIYNLSDHNMDALDNLQTKFTNILISYCNNTNISKYISTDATKLSVFYTRSDLNTDDEKEKAYSFKVCLYTILNECKKFIYGDNELTNNLINTILRDINTDILGDAYERFKEIQASNAGKEAGQYFTPRIVIKYCIDTLIKPMYNETCYDSSTGTGGFIHYLNKYISQHYSKDELSMFNDNCIYANDKTEELMKPLYINMLLHDINITNIKNRNSLGVENCKDNFEKHNIIVGNPPYGVKVDMLYNSYNNINNYNKNYWPVFIKSGKTKTIKDSMGLFMIHTINSLKVGGRFALIIDRGILNNGSDKNTWQKQLRKYILETCNLEKIILLPKGIFTHTMFDTAIIYGVKNFGFNEPCNKFSTTSVKYYISEFKDAKNKTGFVVNDIPNLEINIKQIVDKDWSLKYDDYVEKVEISYEGIEYKCILDILSFKKSTRQAKEGSDTGKYKFFTSSDKIKYSEYNDFKGEYIIIGNGGKGSCHYINEEFSCSADNYIFYSKSNNINMKYTYYFIKLNFNYIYDNLFTGQGLKNLTGQGLKNLKIPILSNEHQTEIVEFLDKFTNGDYNMLDKLVNEFNNIDIFKLLIMKEYDTFELAIIYINKLIDYNTSYSNQIILMKKGLFKILKNYETNSILDILSFKKSTRQAKEGSDTGKYKFFTSSDKIKYSEYNDFKGEYIIIGNGGKGSCHYINEEFSCSADNYIFYSKSNNINMKYTYYFIKLNFNYIYDNLFTGQGLKNLTGQGLKKLKIPVPSLEEQERIVKEIEELDNQDNYYKKGIDSMKTMINTIYTSINTIVNS